MTAKRPNPPARLRTASELEDLLFTDGLSLDERQLLVRESNAMSRAGELRELYRMTGNRLAIWRIYRVYREAGLPIPDDVLRELDRVAEGLEAASGPVEIANVLGLTGRKGGPQGATRLRKSQTQIEVLGAIQYELDRAKGRWPAERAYEIAGARFGRTPGAIKRMWMEYNEPIRIFVGEAIEQSNRPVSCGRW